MPAVVSGAASPGPIMGRCWVRTGGARGRLGAPIVGVGPLEKEIRVGAGVTRGADGAEGRRGVEKVIASTVV